jgi:(hydroxyamino)benzene mutase
MPSTPVAVRHPLDPDPVRSGKANAVLALGIVAAVTGFFVGGLVPATLALLLAADARREMVAARGYLTGGRRLRAGVALAWAGIVLAATAIVLAAIVGLLHMAGSGGGQHLGPNVN